MVTPRARTVVVSACSYLVALAMGLVPAAPAEAAVTALVASNQLVVAGDGANNDIIIRVVAGDASRLEVLGGTTVVGSFARATFTSIFVNAVGGNDRMVLSSINGEVTENATLNGGPGIDVMSGGAGANVLNGGTESDTFFWSPGEGTSVVEGGDGTDALLILGSADAELFDVSANGARVRIARDVDNVEFDVGTTEILTINASGGNDNVFANTGNLAPLVQITLEGSAGDDLIAGSNGNDTLIGNDGNDIMFGGQGNDLLRGGPGLDRMVWSVGDGNDTLEGGADTDEMVFNGNDAIETFDTQPNGGRVRFTRNVGNIVMDLDDVEILAVFAFGGADIFTTAPSLAGTDVFELHFDGGDQNDTISGSDTDDVLNGGAGVDIIDGRAGNDQITPGDGNDTSVLGGPGNDTFFWFDNDDEDILDAELGVDKFFYNGSGGGDTVTIDESFGRVLIVHGGVIVIELRNFEEVDVSTLDGPDNVSVGGELTGVVALEVGLGAGNDTLATIASSTVIADGGPDQDTLHFNTLSQPISTTATTIAAGGVTRVTHRNFEPVALSNVIDQPPITTIVAPTTNPATTATTPFILLEGTAADAIGIASVTWTNNRGGSGAATGTTAWSAPNVPLAAGANVITVTATDTFGNQASDVLSVTVNTLSYTMAEGATGGFFDTDILIANPNSVVAPITITYLKGDGSTVTQNLDLPATSRTTIAVESLAGLESAEVSSTVTSTNALPLVVERTMRWDAAGYGAHTERATDAPTTTWYFAEGSQGFFQTFVLLANPGAVANDATITFLLESGPPVVKTFALTPTSRRTVDASTIPELANQSFGIVVQFTQPGVAERAMYFSTPGTPVFNAGHESAGVNAPSTSWFLAEGATGSFFTTFVLLANPGTSDATATVSFLPASGLPVTKTHAVPAGRRLTLNIAAEDASLADSPVATQVLSTQPILVERAQYWPFSPDRWYEAHNSFGGTALGTKWGLAEGRVGGPEGYQTYILLANANPTQSANVTVTFLRTNGTTVAKAYSVGPTSRFNVHVNSLVPELVNESFGAVVEVTSGPGIFVERALYSDTPGAPFAAGTNALATRLP